MTGVETFTHDSPEKAGGEYYERIAADEVVRIDSGRPHKIFLYVMPGGR